MTRFNKTKKFKALLEFLVVKYYFFVACHARLTPYLQ